MDTFIQIFVVAIVIVGIATISVWAEDIRKKIARLREYRGFRFEIGLPEGFTILDKRPNKGLPFEGAAEILGWSAPSGDAARDAIISLDKYPIRMFVKVIGFQDFRAPSRDWGERRIYDKV